MKKAKKRGECLELIAHRRIAQSAADGSAHLPNQILHYRNCLSVIAPIYTWHCGTPLREEKKNKYGRNLPTRIKERDKEVLVAISD